MNKKQISGLYMKENILMGAIAFLLGIGVGMFFQQILMTIFYRVFGMDYPLHVQLNGWSMLMTSGIYILCYFFALDPEPTVVQKDDHCGIDADGKGK